MKENIYRPSVTRERSGDRLNFPQLLASVHILCPSLFQREQRLRFLLTAGTPDVVKHSFGRQAFEDGSKHYYHWRMLQAGHWKYNWYIPCGARYHETDARSTLKSSTIWAQCIWDKHHHLCFINTFHVKFLCDIAAFMISLAANRYFRKLCSKPKESTKLVVIETQSKTCDSSLSSATRAVIVNFYTVVDLLLVNH